MVRYRIPYHMFLRWFVPYSPGGAFGMASLFVPLWAALALCFSRSEMVAGILILFQLIWGTVVIHYHRRVRFAIWFLSEAIGIGLILTIYAFLR